MEQRNLKILVADDELSIRRLFEIGLRDSGFSVTTAKNGLEALDKIKKESFDLFIVDLRMPGLDGLATVGKMRQLNPDLPVILQGSYKDEESAQKAASLGVKAYLVKPFEWSRLLETVAEILGISVPL